MYQEQSCNHIITATTSIPLSSIKQRSTCLNCDCNGPNLWICLFKNCYYIGCSEKSNDHSTQHYIANPSHCIQMNLWTKRLWCYVCNREVFLDVSILNADSEQEIDLETLGLSAKTHLSSERGGGSGGSSGNICDFEKPVGLNVGMGGDVSDSSDDEDNSQYTDKPCGLVGLQNIGNTCYMNAALQALSNALPLARFFLDCPATVHLLSEGKKPGLSRTFQILMTDIWLKKNAGFISPSGILYGIRNVYPMFRGYYQHDTQEFLRNFMDQLHEELKQIAPPEHAPSNDSDSFSSAMDELPITCDSSEGEYETCDSGVSERSSLSDDMERSPRNAKKRQSRSLSPERRIRSKLQNINNVMDSQPILNAASSSSTSITNSNSNNNNNNHHHNNNNNNISNKKQIKYRSIISDIFDGKLLSSVQCLTCDRISSRVETFQDLSLPIPSRDHLVVLHGRTNTATIVGACSTKTSLSTITNDSWMSWILAWIKSWFYGPTVTLHDCLAAFFSTDELKGDNMYSCEKCNKLRNGIKFSKVLQLPEILCIHLKRFRHELMFSSKISASVSFPLKGLDMKPYLHNDCISKVTSYELFSIICHYGTAGGGHYICYALNGDQWYEFDDQYVTHVTPEKVQSCEAYVLFYRKVTNSADKIREKVINFSKLPADIIDDNFEITCISKQWLNRFYTCAEPGQIDNSDFLCQHGSINPDIELYFEQLTVAIPLHTYEYLYKIFGGCPPLTQINICVACQSFNKRLLYEMETFLKLSKEAQLDIIPRTHLLSLNWYTQWQKFVQRINIESPGPIDNNNIDVNDMNDCVEVTEAVWNFFYNIYGGGPEIKVKETVLQNENDNNLRCNDNEKEEEEDIPRFVTPLLKRVNNTTGTIDKSLYCSGEPMETVNVDEKVDSISINSNNTCTNECRSENTNTNAISNNSNSNNNDNNDNEILPNSKFDTLETRKIRRRRRN